MKITKKDIIKATRELLLVGGYDYLTFARLSQTLNVTRPALYKHYETKDDLIIEMMLSEMQQFLEDLPELVNNETEDILEVLFNKFSEFSDIHRLLESLYRIDYETKQKYPEKLLALKEAHNEFKFYLDRLINRGKSQAIFSEELPNELIVKFLMNSINMIEESMSPKDINLVKKMILTGISPN